jgi:hypothetical protein
MEEKLLFLFLLIIEDLKKIFYRKQFAFYLTHIKREKKLEINLSELI